MTQIFSFSIAFLLVLALVPLALRWVRQRSAAGVGGAAMASKVVSAVAVGPQQRVVTVEVGPPGQRTWLVLGVTAQAVTCLHRVAVEPQVDGVESDASQGNVLDESSHGA